MRIVLGALFGCIVSLPFCFPYFKEFTAWVLNGGHVDAGRGVLLLVPFLLGFSTTLIMALLNCMISGIETMFGIERRTAKEAPSTIDTPATSEVQADLAPAALPGARTSAACRWRGAARQPGVSDHARALGSARQEAAARLGEVRTLHPANGARGCRSAGLRRWQRLPNSFGIVCEAPAKAIVAAQPSTWF